MSSHPLNQFIGPPLSLLPPLAIVSSPFPSLPSLVSFLPLLAFVPILFFFLSDFYHLLIELILEIIKGHRRRANSIRLLLSRQTFVLQLALNESRRKRLISVR